MRLTLAVAIAGVALALGAGIEGHHDAARIDRLEQSMAVEQRLNVIQDAINEEQEQWDDKAAEKLEQETEANQL